MRPLILASALLLVASVTSAQTALFSVEGPADRDWFGFKTRSAGDVDADGRDDLIVNNVILDGPNFSAYVVRVLSGENGRVLYEYADETAPRFGWAVSGAGDVDADGHDDFMISDYGYTEDPDISGRVLVYSGAHGGVLLDIKEAGHGGDFGYDLAPAGDVDGDGHDDLIIGSPDGFTPTDIRDAIVVHSGADGSQLREFAVPYDSGDPIFGRGVAPAGDVDGDGTPDVMGMGWWFCEFANWSYSIVWSGATGEQLLFLPENCSNGFILASTGVGDVNGDGFDDIAVGKAGAFTGVKGGQFKVHSGEDGEIIHHVIYDGDEVEGDGLGTWIAAAGDVNHDDHPDILVGAPQDPGQVFFNGDGPGYAQVFSGLDASVLCTVTGEVDAELFGRSVAAGDFDGDGFSDIAVAAPRATIDGDFGVGRLDVFSLYTPWTTIPGGVEGTLGFPRLNVFGATVAGNPVTLHVSNAPPHAPTVLVLGTELLNAPAFGGVIVPSLDVTVAVTLDGAGEFVLTKPWPQGVPGPDLVWIQAWIEDPAGPEGLSATPTLAGAIKG